MHQVLGYSGSSLSTVLILLSERSTNEPSYLRSIDLERGFICCLARFKIFCSFASNKQESFESKVSLGITITLVEILL